MTKLKDHDRYQHYAAFADKLLKELPRETIAEAARILAMNMAYYRATYGKLPPVNVAVVMAADGTIEISAQDTKLLADGMETLASVLALAMEIEDETDRNE